MLEVITKGIGFGLILSLAVGPVFFTLLKTSLQKGFKAGLYTAIGVSFSDVVFILLAYGGLSPFFKNDIVKQNLALVGGAVVIVFGIYTLLHKPVAYTVNIDSHSRTTYVRQIFKGFAVNSINPTVFVFWLGVVSLASVDYQFIEWKIGLFFASIVATVLTMDITKAHLANKLRGLLSTKVMRRMYLVVGCALIILGGNLIFTQF